MSTWVRRWVVPRTTHSRIRFAARFSVDSGKWGTHTGRARRLAHPRQAGQRLVEMHVAIDQPGQDEITTDVERRRAVRGCGRALAHNCELPAGDADINKTTVGDAAIGQERLDLAHAPIPRSFCLCGMLRFLEPRADGSLVPAG